MKQINRYQIELGRTFEAPSQVTFGYQKARNAFSVWFVSGSSTTTTYIAVGTGQAVNEDLEIVASVVIDDFEVYHLCRVKQ